MGVYALYISVSTPNSRISTTTKIEKPARVLKGLIMADQSDIKDLKNAIAQLRRMLVVAESRETIEKSKKTNQKKTKKRHV